MVEALTKKYELENLRDQIINRILSLGEEEFLLVASELASVLDSAQIAIKHDERTGDEQSSSILTHEMKSNFAETSDRRHDEIKLICQRWDTDAKDYRGRVFDWVRDNLMQFIPGLTQGHLRANSKLYRAFHHAVKADGLPADLDVPTDWEARTRRARELGPDGLLAKQRAAARTRSQDVKKTSCDVYKSGGWDIVVLKAIAF